MKVFLFDINRCVGCNACVAACANENELQAPYMYRQVNNYNSIAYPSLPLFSVSLACNHCEEPVCMDVCPSAAYYRDEKTGAVLINSDRCIGCAYCSWACPWDAPVFNKGTRIMEKCTLCYSRIGEGGEPACTLACPVDALGFGEDPGEGDKPPGFPQAEINPGIRFTGKRETKVPHIYPRPDNPDNMDEFIKEPASGIDLRSDWSLLVFTLLLPILVASVTGVYSAYLKMHPMVYLFASLAAFVVSTLHLGKPERAPFAFRNLKTSWLSREVLLFVLFVISSFTYLLFFYPGHILGMASVVLGFMLLFAADRLYRFFENEQSSIIHSSWLMLSGLLWISLLIQEILPLLFVIVVKLALYSARQKWTEIVLLSWRMVVVLIRIFSAISAFILFYTGVDIYIVFVLLFLGEIIDRTEFYTLQYVMSPARKNYMDQRKNALLPVER